MTIKRTRSIKAGDKVRILTNTYETGMDSRMCLKQYSIANVVSTSKVESFGKLTVRSFSKSVYVNVEDVELVRDTDLSLGEVLDCINNDTLKEGDTVTVKDETMVVFKDGEDGLGLKQVVLSDSDDSTNDKDLLHISARYVNRSYHLPPLKNKIQVSKEDLELQYNAEIEIID